MATPIAELTNEQLREYRDNAYTTACQALGHTKGSMNDGLVEAYEAELKTRGITFDHYKSGSFNGPGSW